MSNDQASSAITIEGFKREQTGKGYARKLRAKGLIPANLQVTSGNQNLELDPKWLPRVWKTGKVFNLTIEGKEQQVAMTDVQYHAVSRQALHVDLKVL